MKHVERLTQANDNRLTRRRDTEPYLRSDSHAHKVNLEQLNKFTETLLNSVNGDEDTKLTLSNIFQELKEQTDSKEFQKSLSEKVASFISTSEQKFGNFITVNFNLTNITSNLRRISSSFNSLNDIEKGNIKNQLDDSIKKIANYSPTQQERT